jgi:regulator of PEP synthase PpsR (kinase-PPPase family)
VLPALPLNAVESQFELLQYETLKVELPRPQQQQQQQQQQQSTRTQANTLECTVFKHILSKLLHFVTRRYMM